MTSLVLHYSNLRYRSFKGVMVSILFLTIIALFSPYKLVYAQEMDNKHKWSIGLQAGVLAGNLPTSTATNALVSRFSVENNYYFTGAIKAGVTLSEFESLNLTVSRGEFSVFTDHEFWPDVVFNNQFYNADLSAHFDVRRFIESLPVRLDPFGTFGLGVMSNRNTVSPLNPMGTNQSDFSDDTSKSLSFLIKAGFGLNYSLSSRVSLIFQFNHHFLNNDIIDKNLAGDILRNEFVRTTNNWSTFTSGIKLKFGRERVRTQIDPLRDDFQVVSTVSPNQSLVSDEQTSELSDSLDRRQSETDTTEIELPSTPAETDLEVKTQIPEESSENVLTVLTEISRVDIQDEVQTTPDIPVNEIESTDTHSENRLFEAQPKYGLNGIVTEEIPGSFAISLYSYSNHDAANKVINDLNDEGYRVVIQFVTINDTEFKRVAIGQFESRRDARLAAENLPEPYSNNYFIIQI